RTNIDIEGIEKSVESFDFYGINIITISTYYKFENMIKPYMQFDFIQSIMPKYFDDHILIIVITSTTGGTFFKNTRLVNYNGKLQLRAGIR
ncbi:MAG: hypothetical protein FWC97_11505, partial [Treponema sp.]|nr:hypothetical protein [Treponema sp.]